MMKSKYIYVKGKYVSEDKAVISVHERGFMFGDGVFETMRCLNKEIADYEWHKERLEKALKALKIALILDNIANVIAKLLELNQENNCLVRLSVSRGIGSMGYFPMTREPTLVIETKPLISFSYEAKDLYLSKYNKISNNALPVEYKLMQGLNQTLAIMEARDNDCFESLMLNEQKEVCEVTSANIFWDKDNLIYTPSLACGLLAGITRRRIINQMKIEEGKYSLDHLLDADVIFLTNIAYEIMPIRRLRQKDKIIWQSKLSERQIEEYRKALLSKINNLN